MCSARARVFRSDWAAPGARPAPVSEASHCTTQHTSISCMHIHAASGVRFPHYSARYACGHPQVAQKSIRESGTKSLQRPKPPSELGLLSKSSQRPGVCMLGVKKPHQACLCAWLAITLTLTLKSSGAVTHRGAAKQAACSPEAPAFPGTGSRHREHGGSPWVYQHRKLSQRATGTLQLPNQAKVSRLTTDSET